MKRGPVQRSIFAFLLIMAISGGIPDSQCLSADSAHSKVAVLPFSMHVPAQLAYLQDGIRDMLSSRLAWQGKVQVIDRTATNQALQGHKSDISLDEALSVARNLKADYVLFGSMTALGQSISIDAKMAPVSGNAEPVTLVAQTKSLDDVIPRINQFAQDINQKIFARPADSSMTASSASSGSGAENEGMSNRNPELLVPDSMIESRDKISYLNPNFVEVTSDASLHQPGIWRSQTFSGGIVGMDIGDLDGDGRTEIVTVTKDKVTVFRKENQGLQTIGSYDGTKMDHFLWVSVVDSNRDGHAKIFVTNLRKLNQTRPSQINTAAGDQGYLEELRSFVLSYDNGKLQVVAKDIPYFLNGIDMPKQGKVLIGQEKARRTEGTFKSGIYEMQLAGGTLRPSTAVNVPRHCNVFNFAFADVKNDHSNDVAIIDGSNRLVILNPAGDRIWKSDKLFAATTNTFEGRVEDRRYNQVDLYGIPSPILITDLNKDGTPEIVVNRSSDSLGKFLPNALKYFDKGEIVSLAWDNMGLVENWKTREIAGMVTSMRIGDLNNSGTPQLIVSIVMAKDLMKLWESKSVIFSYDLNVSAAKKAPEKKP